MLWLPGGPGQGAVTGGDDDYDNDDDDDDDFDDDDDDDDFSWKSTTFVAWPIIWIIFCFLFLADVLIYYWRSFLMSHFLF